MALTLVTGPTQEPVTINELKAQTRIDVDTQDDLLRHYIQTAREFVEGQCRRAIMSQTWDYDIDGNWPMKFGGYRITLPLNPVQSVTWIRYIDGTSPNPTLAASQYTVAARRHGSFIVPAYNVTWPGVRNVPSAITVRFVVGNSSQIPLQLKQAIMLIAAHMEANRGDGPNDAGDVPGLEALISPWRKGSI